MMNAIKKVKWEKVEAGRRLRGLLQRLDEDMGPGLGGARWTWTAEPEASW